MSASSGHRPCARQASHRDRREAASSRGRPRPRASGGGTGAGACRGPAAVLSVASSTGAGRTPPMFEPFAPAIDAFAKLLARNYRELFGRTEPDHAPVLRATARLALERIAATDALYHDALHTLFVADVGPAILRGRAMVEPVSREGWLHLTVATLLHDVGYLRGVCPGDGDGRYVIAAAGNTVAAPRGATAAFLAPWHVELVEIYVRRRCAAVAELDVERLFRAIELTRFPVPEARDPAEAESEAGLVRAADLIGQLADPAYPRRLAALFCEF